MTRRPGFTLVEIVLTLALISIALVPTVNMWLASSRANQATDEETKALILAQLIIESKVRIVPFAAQQSATGTDADSGLPYTLTVTSPTTTTHRALVTVRSPRGGAILAQFVTLTAKEN